MAKEEKVRLGKKLAKLENVRCGLSIWHAGIDFKQVIQEIQEFIRESRREKFFPVKDVYFECRKTNGWMKEELGAKYSLLYCLINSAKEKEE